MPDWISQEGCVRRGKSLKEEKESEVESLDENDLAGAIAHVSTSGRFGPTKSHSEQTETIGHRLRLWCGIFRRREELVGLHQHPISITWQPSLLGAAYLGLCPLRRSDQSSRSNCHRTSTRYRMGTEAFDLCLGVTLLSEYGEWAEGSQQAAMDKGEWAEGEFLGGLRGELRRDLVDVSEEAEEFPERFGLDSKADEYLQ